eukprot:365905-Chlamydomonas_euryale.AAC.3
MKDHSLAPGGHGINPVHTTSTPHTYLHTSHIRYELPLAYMVISASPRDPGEYREQLSAFESVRDPHLRRHAIDAHLGRWPAALSHLFAAGDTHFDAALSLARQHGLLRQLLALCGPPPPPPPPLPPGSISLPTFGAPPPQHPQPHQSASPQQLQSVRVLDAYGDELSGERRHEDAAVTFVAAGRFDKAMQVWGFRGEGVAPRLRGVGLLMGGHCRWGSGAAVAGCGGRGCGMANVWNGATKQDKAIPCILTTTSNFKLQTSSSHPAIQPVSRPSSTPFFPHRPSSTPFSPTGHPAPLFSPTGHLAPLPSRTGTHAHTQPTRAPPMQPHVPYLSGVPRGWRMAPGNDDRGTPGVRPCRP